MTALQTSTHASVARRAVTEETAAVVREARATLSAIEIAEQLGLTRQAVYLILRDERG